MAKIKISIRRKSINRSFTKDFLDIYPLPTRKIRISRSFGVLTACNSRLFIGLQFLLTSIAYFYDIIVLVYDTGMTSEQVAWCNRQPNVMVKPFKIDSLAPHMQYAGAWLKSHYVRSSPFRNTIWIDADAMVTGNLTELVEMSNPVALFTSDHTQLQHSTINHSGLYSLLPIGKSYSQDILPYLNTGVFVVNGKRDEKLIDDWCFCVEQANARKEIAATISCWDQGACKWALHKNDLLYLIVPDKKFNHPAKIRHYAYPSSPSAVLHFIQNSKEPCVVLHWMGSPKPWTHWGNSIDLDLSSIK